MTVARELGAWVAALEHEDVPDSARRHACRHLLDGVGVALAAARAGAARPATAVAAGLGGPPEAATLAGGPRVGAPAAALADGALVHALDFDDTHAEALVHATAVVLPAALCVGQALEASGAEVVAAAIAGYEVACRLGAASPHGFHARGLHATGVCGPPAAAAVTARLMRLDATRTADALGIAASSSGGLLEFLASGASTKQLHPGLASAAGIVAARLADAGGEGPPAAFEGERGVYAALSARPAEPARVTRDLGSSWEVERMTVKPYPACQLMHAALDAVAEVRGRIGHADAVRELRVEVHPDSAAIVGEPRPEKARPRSAYDARFSLPWSAALLLADGELTLGSYDAAALGREDVARLAAGVRTVAVPSATVAADAPARAVATTAAGASLSASVPGSSGGPARPMSDEALVAKFTANAGGPSDEAAALAARVLGLERERSLGPLHAAAARLAATAPLAEVRA